jgi:CxxC motif-containing protein (DUF1111 family)
VHFQRPFTPEEGLGPLFNDERCSSCHDLPTSGGAGVDLVTRMSAVHRDGRCDLRSGRGGDNLQRRATPLLAEAGIDREARPEEPVTLAEMAAPALYGLGLVEAVPLATLLQYADPDDADGDGIRGRLARTPDGRPAPFGRKGTHASLRDFVVEALAVEMGLTTRDRPREERPGGAVLPPGSDPAPDPELDDERLGELVTYVRFLAPPARVSPGSETESEAWSRGEELFGRIGCADCHRPTLRTGGENDGVAHPALRNREVALYSDFLLHDLGPGMAGICGPDARPSEYRTAPLVALRHRHRLLHDGRAESVAGAVAHHGGEAAAARRHFQELGPAQRDDLLRFLFSL